ncbi:MAG: hypothetical protein ACKVZH_21485 [Blastocatellia bacterium]
MKLSVIVPCFKEEASLPLLLAHAEPVVQNVFGGSAELIAMDDGSTNRVLAEAWQTGPLAARRETVCTLDADGRSADLPVIVAGHR